jgi:hypothetical protein
MRVAARMCATLALLTAAPAAHAAQVSLTAPLDGQTFSLVDDAVSPVAYSATLVPDALGCLDGSWYVERRSAGAGDDAWATLASGPVALPLLAGTDLRPAGDYELRARLRCSGAADLLSNVARIRVGEGAGLPPLPVPEPPPVPVPVPVPTPTPTPGPGTTPVAPSGILPPSTDDTKVCLIALEDTAAAADALRRARRAARRRPSATRRRAGVRARRQLAAARTAERAAC